MCNIEDVLKFAQDEFTNISASVLNDFSYSLRNHMESAMDVGI